jgi:hypothetical protein
LTTHRHGPLIAQVLVVALLLGSMPMAASPLLAEHDSTPVFMLSICHPLPVLAVSATACTLAVFTAFSFSIVIEERGPTEASDLPVIDHASEAPDPPPPKTLA